MSTLILVRHAHPSPVTLELTERGERQVNVLAVMLKDHLVLPVRIISSPVKRAAQTAAVLAKALDIDPIAVRVYEELACEADVNDEQLEDIARLVEPLSTDGTLIVVSHKPVVEELPGVILKKGAAVCSSGVWYSDALVIGEDGSCKHVSPHGSIEEDTLRLTSSAHRYRP